MIKRLRIQIVGVDAAGRIAGETIVEEILVTAAQGKKTRRRWTKARCVREFADRLRNGRDIRAVVEAAHRLGCWREAIAQFTHGPSLDAPLGKALLDFWMEFGLWSIPRGLKNDLPIFAEALRHALPPYCGPNLTLYRGEQLERHMQGIHGIAWTSDVSVAEMFATRRTALKDGKGIVLRADAPAHAIITGPTAFPKSIEEQEYIVDPRLISPRAYIAI
jgi:hypothetical protein